MSSRLVYLVILFGFTTCAIEGDGEYSPSPMSTTFSNVLLIISDDLATHAVGCYGNEIIRTPNIDRLAAEGARFSRAYANSPMCTPSRAALITGRYPHAAGVTLLRTPLPDSAFTIAEYLKEQGFATGIFGKNHFNSDLKHGFDTVLTRQHHENRLAELPSGVSVRPIWKPFNDPARIWLNAEGATSGSDFANSQGTFFANATIEFMRSNRKRRFLAVASFHEPHSPFNFPIEYANKYDPALLELPLASDEDVRWVPAIFKELTDEEKKGITASYYSSVEYMDRNVGLLLGSLEEMGLAENTLVIFVGDHGYLLNHHGRFEKHMMWEEAITTPLIIRGFRDRVTLDQPVELVDLVPTMLDALALDPMPRLQGQSLEPLLQSDTAETQEYIFAEYLEDNKAMIFDGRWKYIFTTGKRDLGSGYATGIGPSGVLHRLYDLQNDPQETINVASQHPTELGRLQQVMTHRFRDTYPAGYVAGGLTVEAQLVRYCEPPEGWTPSK
ncbi:MAG: sulfatase family protein [Cyclobacteriaceae bacterium]